MGDGSVGGIEGRSVCRNALETVADPDVPVSDSVQSGRVDVGYLRVPLLSDVFFVGFVFKRFLRIVNIPHGEVRGLHIAHLL